MPRSGTTAAYRRALVAGCAAVCASAACPASAADRFWTGGIGTWQTPSHWTPAGSPGGSDIAHFNLDGTHEMHFSGSAAAADVRFEADIASTTLRMQPGETLTVNETFILGNRSSQKNNRVFIPLGGTLHQPSRSSLLHVGHSGYAELWLSGGSDISSSGAMHLGTAATGSGVFVAEGPGTTVNVPTLFVGSYNNATGGSFARFESGASGAFDSVVIGAASAGLSDSLIVRSGATVTVNDTLGVGDRHAGVLNVNGGTVQAYSLTAYNTPGTRVELEAGTLRAREVELRGGSGQLAWTGGTLDITHSSPTIGAGGSLGSSLVLPANAALRISGPGQSLSVGPAGTLRLAGGTLTTGALHMDGDPARLDWTSGTLALTASDLTVGDGGLLGNTLMLHGEKELHVTGAGRTLNLNSSGLIEFGGNTLAIRVLSEPLNWNGGTIRSRGSTFRFEINLGPAGGNLDVTRPTLSECEISGTGKLSKTGQGLLVIGENSSHSGGFEVAQGSVVSAVVKPFGSGPVTVAPNADISLRLPTTVSSLTNNGLVDIGQTTLEIQAGVAESRLRAEIIAGRNGGAWSGASGITSWYAAGSNGRRHLGYVRTGASGAMLAPVASGDTNLDYHVNTDDILNILAGGKLDTNQAANWQEGDFNYDGRANTDDILAILAEGNLDAGRYEPDAFDRGAPVAASADLAGTFPLNARLIYDPDTGNVKVDPNGLQVSGFNLEDVLANARNVFAGLAAPGFPEGGLSTTDADTKVSWAAVSDRFSTLRDLGNVALPGLTAADLLAELSGLPGATDETYYTAQGVTGRQYFDLVVVPEPAALGLAAIAGLGMMGRRRR